MREQALTEGPRAASCCEGMARDTCARSSVSALISQVEGMSTGSAEQQQEDRIVATSSRLCCLCLWMQYRGLKENNPLLFSLANSELEVTAGVEMAVA